MTEPPRRILITGSAGLLGEATLKRLTGLPSTDFAVALDREPTDGPDGETRKFMSVVRDIREPADRVLTDYGVDTVVHLAFILRPPRNRASARAVNVEATERLLSACAAAGVKRFVYLSSTTVYGAHSSYRRPYVETDPVNPVKGFSYSEHKAEAERLVLRFAEERPECAVSVLRGCVVMGKGADNFIASSLDMRILPTPMLANPDMQFLHIDDYASVVEAVLSQQARGVYNIAGGGTVRWREVVKVAGGIAAPVPTLLLKAATGLGWKLRLQGRSPANGINFIRYPWLASTAKIEQELGWRAKYTSRQALDAWVEGRKK